MEGYCDPSQTQFSLSNLPRYYTPLRNRRRRRRRRRRHRRCRENENTEEERTGGENVDQQAQTSEQEDRYARSELIALPM